MSQIDIQDLHLRTIIGIFDWERTHKQDVLINITVDFDSTQAAKTDDIHDTVDYKTMNKKVIELVETSEFKLIETLADRILQVVLATKQVLSASVKVDKPGALRFAKSVGITVNGQNTSK